MLINCPRCGFSQPKDQYCASCGVNIEKYIPRKTSLTQKLLSNIMLQVLVVTSIALATAYFTLNTKNGESLSLNLAMRKKQNISTLNSSSRSSMPENSVQNSDPTLPEPTLSVEVQNESQKNEMVGAADDKAALTATVATVESLNDTEKTTTKSTTKDIKKAITIKYSFYEVDRTILAYWFQLNANQYPPDESAPFRSGEIKAELMHKQVLSEPLKTETKKIVMSENETFTAGLARENSDSFIGILSEFNFNEITDTSAKGLIRLTQKSNQGSEVIRVPLSINKQNIFFVLWKNDIMSFEAEPLLSQIPPFQILRSQRFRSHETEFVMIIEPFF